MTFPFGLTSVSPQDLKRFQRLYEESVSDQPLDDLGEWFLRTYDDCETHGFSDALNKLDFVLDDCSDYVGFVAAKHLLSQAAPGSAVSYQVGRRLLAHTSPLLFRYGLCLVIAGAVLIDSETRDAVARLSSSDEETAQLVQLAKIAIQTGVAPHA